MKTKFLTLLTIVTLFSLHSKAQNNNTGDIKSALASYINAGDINNIEKLKPHLHSDFRVVLFDAKKDAISILDKSTYVSFIETKKIGGYKRTVTYEDIQLIGNNIASVKITLTSPEKPTLKNFYSLVKLKDKWLVVQDYVTLISK